MLNDSAKEPSGARPTSTDTMEDSKMYETTHAVQREETVATSDNTSVAKDDTTVLADLDASVRDQDELERDIGRQADQLLFEQANERDVKRLEKTQRDRERLLGQVRRLEKRLTEFGNHATKNKYRSEIEQFNAQIAALDTDLEQIQKRIDERKQGAILQDGNTLLEDTSNRRMPGESRREFLIRTGKITPFSKMGGQLLKTSSSLGDVLMDAEEESNESDEDREAEEEGEQTAPLSHRNLLAPGFEQDDSSATSAVEGIDGDAELARRLQEEEFASGRPAKRRRLRAQRHIRTVSQEANPPGDDSDEYLPNTNDAGTAAIGESTDDAEPTDDDLAAELPLPTTPGISRRKGPRKQATEAEATQEDLAGIDDGNEQVYQTRLQNWVERRATARRRHRKRRISTENIANNTTEVEDEESSENDEVSQTENEWHRPHPTRTDTQFEGGLRIPGDIYPSLFDYQKTGVQWLWELYSQQVGGIIGDEMGLGKTIQIISFLAGLHYSKKLAKPILIVCPATLMKQWVNEFHRWWPPLRVSILHTSGSGMLDVRREARIEDDLELDTSYRRRATHSKGHQAAKRIVDRASTSGHVLVTTYSGLQTYAELLIPTDWQYAVLDEGHKIRNPNTAITIYCKELRTHNRVILSGTPMQNNLTELWSLFDFVFPMRLGTLVTFRNQFEIPIKQGGYANATNLQVETAMKCAETLKDTISPYLLQRFKVDVAADLPRKSERVLFCKLTKLQRDAYEWFLASDDMKSILGGKRQALYGVDILRKICNHPDLVEHKTLSKKVGYAYGSGVKSGKMQVVKALLEIWKRGGHKTLLFAQHRIMLDILELFVRGMEGFAYRRMDGNTSIKDRQDLVDEFNRDPGLHVFLLTTKVGGLGINLTGADRVIIYDPDWNPSTDVQARERAWRLGQKREVEIYRLMTAGTIEEKIYHRQIFKQFLTNKILRDPKQRQTFQLRDLHDLFTLGDVSGEAGSTETGSIFKGTEVQWGGSTKGKEKEEEEKAQGLLSPPDDGRRNGEKTGAAGIMGVSREEHYRDSEAEGNEGVNDDTDPDTSRMKDDRMLSSIFARTGVHSALEHDAIINGESYAAGKKKVRADPQMIAREARKVAAEAARQLQEAGEIARTLPAGEVTWTGQVGTAGRPEDERRGLGGGRGGRGGRGGMGVGRGIGRGGPSSASVIANLRARQPGSATVAASSAPSPSSRGMGRSDELQQQALGTDFMVLIRDFLLSQGGAAHTQMLIDHFNRFCRTEQRTAEFREMLRTIAVLDKGGRGGGRGRWVLREEYRPSVG